MKKIQTKRFLSLLIALALTVSLLSGLSLTVFADTLLGTPTGYTSASQVVYQSSDSYLKNWGARGETASFLTTYAQSYYTGSYTYASLSANSGSSSSSGYTSSALYNALHAMLAAKQSFETSYNGTRELYCLTDCVNSNSSYISSFYSGTRLNGAWDSGQTWNREHTWPQSKTEENSQQLSDIMMLRPTSVTENSGRGNKAYGESTGYYHPNAEAGSTGLDLRGDCARIVLYCYVRWSENAPSMWGTDGVMESVDVLLNWIQQDPVDTWEMGRNDAVQSITGARNCFVDYPELAFLLFGRSIPTDMSTPSNGQGGSAPATVTLTYVANGAVCGTASTTAGQTVYLPSEAPAVSGWTFSGWVESELAATTTHPVFTVPGGGYTPSADVTLYALYTQSEGGSGSGSWARMSSAAELASGVQIVLACQSKGVTAGNISNSVMASTTSSFSADGQTITSLSGDAMVLTLGGSSGAWTLANPDGQLLGATAVKKLAWGSGTTTWNISFSGADATIQSTTSSYGRFLYNSGSPRFTTYTSATNDSMLLPQIYYLDGTLGTVTYTTSPEGQTHTHSYGSWSANNDGTHSRSCACGDTQTENCSYTDVVTPPTATEQGYTTHTCGVCGYSYVDSYTDPTGENYTVTFTTPDGITAPAAMTINSLTGATLPTADAPAGYTFLGWVTEDYDNVTTMPAQILTGLYMPTADVTLKALYSYDDYGENPPRLTLMSTSDTFSDGDKIVITAAGTDRGLYRESYLRTYAKDFEFTNDAADILADAKKYFPVTQRDDGWWLGDDANGYLYTPDNQENLTIRTYNESFMTAFTLTTYDGHLALKHTVNYNDNEFYVKCGTDFSGGTQYKWRMIDLAHNELTGVVALDIYKLTEGGPAAACYTTIIDLPHEHTPAEPVIENEIAATCTAPGSYDSVVYCTECGEELSRETVTVPSLGHDYAAVVTEPSCTASGYTTYTCARCGDSYVGDAVEALGHNPGEPVQENYTEPTATTPGGYDTVVYCQRCGEELNREHTVLPATAPIETSALRIYSSISVGTDMVVTWSARKTDVASYSKFWIEVVKHAPAGDETYLYGADQPEALVESSSTWQLNFKHIFAKEMGVQIEARVYAQDANGQVYMSPAKSTTIRDYLAGRLVATTNPVAQRTLAADMLNYGAAAQLYMGYETDHLVNQELTATQLAKLHQYETKTLPVVEKTNSNYRPAGTANILFNSVSLDNEVVLFLTVLGSEGNEVKVLMKDHETGTVLETLDTAWNGSKYTVEYTGIGADKMRVAYDFVAQINGAETGNVRTWSVEGYVGEIRNGGNQLQIDVANALLVYGDSAAAYFAAQ